MYRQTHNEKDRRMETVESKMIRSNYDVLMQTLDKAIALDLLKHQQLYKLKFMIFRKNLALSHYNQWWIEKEVTKKEANKIFDEFLELYEKSYGKKFNNYSRMNRSIVFECFRGFMIRDFIYIRKLES
jgi:hypothetical protein